MKATFRSRWWRSFFGQIKHCYRCGRLLRRRFVAVEQMRRHVCESCSSITYINPKVVAGLIPMLPDGRVVLLQRAIEPGRGLWSFPAGFMELGETVQQAALRETYEEIGVRAKIDRLVGIYSYPDAGVVTIVYSGRVSARQVPKAMPETLAVNIFHPTDVPWKKLAFRSVHEALKDWNCQLSA